jgi:alpha-tubulin suppressor-like RCC1 family protein
VTGTNFASVYGGMTQMCTLDTSGVAACWGSNSAGLLTGAMTTMFGGQALVKLSVGETHVCGLTAAGVALCTGTNSGGDLGFGTTKSLPSTYYTVAAPVTFASISSGTNHSCALGTDGHAYCWGRNSSGAVGDGTTAPRAGAVIVVGATP